MQLCSKCKKRPEVVFLSDMTNPNAEPNGLCLVCAKEMGLKPIIHGIILWLILSIGWGLAIWCNLVNCVK